MRLAITGATGFLGSHLLNAALEQGHQVSALARAPSRLPPQVEVVLGELPERVPPQLLHGADVLIHLAAAGVQWEGRSTLDLHAVNVLGSLQLLNAAKAAGVSHVVLVGSALEYRGHGTLPHAKVAGSPRCHERDSIETSDRYGSSKAAAGLLARAEARRLKLPTWYLRLCSVYGPGDRSTKLLPAAVRAARAGRAFAMTAGEQVRDWLQVNDAVRALLRAAELPPDAKGTTLNVGSGEAVELHSLIETVFGAAGADPALIQRGAIPYREDEVHQLVLEPSTGQAGLDWRPNIPLQTGLGLLVTSG